MDRGPATEASSERLAAYLGVLASPARLDLLRQLREPRSVREISLRPAGPSALNAGRSISDQAVRKHLARLEDAGLVVTRPGRRGGAPVEERIVNHAMLFAIVEELRDVARLAPTVPLAPAATLTQGRALAAPPAQGARLIVVHGSGEGQTFPLAGGRGASPEWTIGRREGLAVSLDYDPFVSLEHAAVGLAGGQFRLRDLPRSKNGTRLNWCRLPRGGTAPLATGDVVGVGRSLLLFRAG